MPGTGNTMFTYDYGFSGGSVNREDLEDIIVNIAPLETPLFSTLQRTPVNHTLHEWLEDDLPAASPNPYATNYVQEGADFSAVTVAPPTRKHNWVQVFRKDIKVSETQRVVNPAGMRDLYQYEIEKSMKEIARHMERKFFDPNSTTSGTASGAYRSMKSLGAFIGSTTAEVACAAAGSATFGRGAIDFLIEKCVVAGGNPQKIYCHPNSKTQFSNFLSGVNTRNVAASDGRVVGNIDTYNTNFNMVELVPDRFIPATTATAAAFSNATADGRWWLLDQTYIKLGVLRPLKHVPIPPAGDAVRGMVLTEATLVVKAPLAHSYQWNVVSA